MVPERLLVGSAAALVLLSTVAAVAVPGALTPADDDPAQPARLLLAEMNIAPDQVSGDDVTLGVETRIAHRGGPATNVTLLVRAVGAESGLVEATRTVDVPPITEEREAAVTVNLTVPRAGGYRIETVVFQDGRRVASGSRTVRGLEALQPAYARTPVEFHRFARTDQPVIAYAVEDVSDGQVSLRLATHLTNTGSEPAGGLRLALTARQADSNVIADQTDVTIGEIQPGRTATPSADLVVPEGYNYYLDAILWKDGVIVGTARSVANLDPSETIAANVTRREVGLDVSDFEREGGEPRPEPEPTESGGQPGFTAGLAAVALLAIALVGRRWSA